MREKSGEHHLLSSFAPAAFLALRDLWAVSEDVLCTSLLDNRLSGNSSGGGRSGAFMFFSSDGRFVVKSMTQSEARLLRKILPNYIQYCSKYPGAAEYSFAESRVGCSH